MKLEKYDQMLKPNMIKVRSNVVRSLIIFMGSTMKLSWLTFGEVEFKSLVTELFTVKDIGCNG